MNLKELFKESWQDFWKTLPIFMAKISGLSLMGALVYLKFPLKPFWNVFWMIAGFCLIDLTPSIFKRMWENCKTWSSPNKTSTEESK